jgi:tRNA threonylcarbamoyladenosine biosynthesis protein TsaE
MILSSEADTQKAAQAVAAQLAEVDCLTLEGTLGVGKTTLMRHLIAALGGGGEQVLSPTFMLIQDYTVQVKGKPVTLWHLDAYRLKQPAECRELGLEEMFREGIVCIEWPEICAGYLPKNRLRISMDYHENNGRRLTLEGFGRWKPLTGDISHALTTLNA